MSSALRASLVVVAVALCRDGSRPPEAILLSGQAPDSAAGADLDYGRAALLLTKKYFPEYDVQAGIRELDGIASRVRALLATRPGAEGDPEMRIAAINTVLYRELGFAYDQTDMMGTRLENRLLGMTLKRRLGTCATLPDLYYAVAERLGYPIVMARAPQHAYLRYELGGGEHMNIEATGAGGESSDEAIAWDMEIPEAAIKKGGMLQPMTKREAMALLFEAEAGIEVTEKHHFAAAIPLFAKALQLTPRSVETAWNLALAYARVGDGPRALRLAQQAMEGGLPPPLTSDYFEREQRRRRARSEWRNEERLAAIELTAGWDPVAEMRRIIAVGLPDPTRTQEPPALDPRRPSLAEVAKQQTRNARTDRNATDSFLAATPSSSPVERIDRLSNLAVSRLLPGSDQSPVHASAPVVSSGLEHYDPPTEPAR
jgi:regulator of sirC expression with transglutaminase-like and TPR domain